MYLEVIGLDICLEIYVKLKKKKKKVPALEHQLWALRRQLFCLDEFQMVWHSSARNWALERRLRDGSWMFQVI